MYEITVTVFDDQEFKVAGHYILRTREETEAFIVVLNAVRDMLPSRMEWDAHAEEGEQQGNGDEAADDDDHHLDHPV